MVSCVITVDSIKQLNKILKRKIMIWDNIHANDYDPKRVFLGPYKGDIPEVFCLQMLYYLKTHNLSLNVMCNPISLSAQIGRNTHKLVFDWLLSKWSLLNI